MITLKLPYPPTSNHYYTVARSRKILSKRGRAYRLKVWAVVKQELPGFNTPLDGRLSIGIEWFPPDNRLRDGDNIEKALFDSLKYAGVVADDSRFVYHDNEKGDKVKDGFVIVRIKEWKWRLGYDAKKQKPFRYK